jgi:rhamnogalacturonan endolyase
VKTETPDLVDIGFRRQRRDEPQHLDCEIHYVLTRGASGLYTYAILSHPADYPEAGYGEWRFVWKHPDGLLEKIYVDEARHWTMPSPEDFRAAKPTGIKEIVQLTTGPWAGKYDCKYDYSVSYHDVGCWGHASDKNGIGQWLVLGGYDYLNDGPTKQDLNAAHGYALVHFGRNHFNGSTVKVPAGQTWEKLFGPFLLYCNSSSKGGDGCWADAKAQVQAEKAAWPYAWMTNIPSYPTAAQRGAVSGQLVIKDSLKPDLKPTNTWVGLFDPSAGKSWQFDSMGYQYWAKADQDGNFTIPAVRPGNYTLYAFTEGVVGEFSKQGVVVEASKTNALGAVAWDVPHQGRSIAWEIGIPDRTAKEFRHGSDGIKDYIWSHFQEEFPNPLEYTVGKSDPAKDWNYAHSWYQVGDKRLPWKWRVNFDLAAVPSSGDAVMTIAFAAAHARAHVNVYVNDETHPLGMVTPSIQGGNAMLRDSNHAKYCIEYFKIPVSLLKKGANTITLEQTGTDAQSHVMYDYINLELP